MFDVEVITVIFIVQGFVRAMWRLFLWDFCFALFCFGRKIEGGDCNGGERERGKGELMMSVYLTGSCRGGFEMR